MDPRPPVFQVVGSSGSGKTTAIERCVRRLCARGLRVAVVKHSHHAPDLRTKDSDRFRAAGASIVMFAGARAFLEFLGPTESLVPLLPADVVLVEGFSRQRFGRRYRTRGRRDVGRIVAAILAATPRARPQPTVRIDGERRRADDLWRFVLNLMVAEGVDEVRRR